MAGESLILAEFLAELSLRDLRGEEVEKVKLCLLDLLGSALAGARERPAEIVVGLVRRMGGSPEATVILHGDRVPSPNAALANGVLSHIVEMDDVHRGAILHPGAVVIPSALAVAELLGAGGKELIEALAAGYEAAIRVGEAAGPSHYRYWHSTGTCGTFGAAAAAGRLLGLDAEGMLNALGNAGTQASGLWEFLADGAMSKHLHTGKAAYNGVLSALLASEGFTGARAILEGERGFLRAASERPEPDRLTVGLGGGLKIMEVSLKPHASCRHTHPAIDAALAIAREYSPRLGDVEAVRVKTYSAALEIAGVERPRTPYEAKFSIPYCVASALLHGRVGLGEFTWEVFGDRRLRGLMERVAVEVDLEIDAQYPSKWPAEVKVETRSGDHYRVMVDFPLGDPENPLGWGEVGGKFRELASEALDQEHIGEIVKAVGGLEHLSDVGELMELLR